MQAADPFPAPIPFSMGTLSTREWLVETHTQLRRHLPPLEQGALLTAELVEDDGEPVDVFRHFKLNPRWLVALWYNLPGILYSAQSTGQRYAEGPADPWPGFEDVWIPVNGSLRLSARLGLAKTNGRPMLSDCIIVLPGLFGDNTTLRSRDVAIALREAGLHVLSLEQRSHGQTLTQYPDIGYTYGVFEAGDILAVAEWLQARPEVRDTGVVGFCWGGNTALLAAWEENRRMDDWIVSERLAALLRPRSPKRLLRAGVIAFSPAVRFEELLERLDRPWSLLEDPVAQALGRIVAGRAKQQCYQMQEWTSLRELVRVEAQFADADYPELHDDGMEYLRLLECPDEGRPNKLEAVRVPVLIVQGVDDPVTSAQGIADLFAQLHNPNVAGVVLPGGGHCGFAPYARRYFYSLILNFYDRRHGAAACLERRYADAPRAEILSSSN